METAMELWLTFGNLVALLVTLSLAIVLLAYPFRKYFVNYNEKTGENKVQTAAFYSFSLLIALLMLFILSKINFAYYEYMIQVSNYLHTFLVFAALAFFSSVFSSFLSFAYSLNFDNSEKDGTFMIPISVGIGIPTELIVLLISVFNLVIHMVFYGFLFVVFISTTPTLSLALTIAGAATFLAEDIFDVKINMDKNC